MAGAASTCSAAPYSTTRPRYMTAMLSATCAATPRSCVISMIAMPNSS
ncbi:hypothetical protein ACFQQB_41300 [Nonomuraea rubra]